MVAYRKCPILSKNKIALVAAYGLFNVNVIGACGFMKIEWQYYDKCINDLSNKKGRSYV